MSTKHSTTPGYIGGLVTGHIQRGQHSMDPQRQRELADPSHAAFEDALRETWQMVDVFKPAGQPGSYARGEHNGIVAALQTIRENYERARRTRGVQAGSPFTFHWLVELRPAFEGHPPFPATYYSGWIDGIEAAKTTDPLEAVRFTSKEHAERMAKRLGFTLSCVWQAVEHGFADLPASADGDGVRALDNAVLIDAADKHSDNYEGHDIPANEVRAAINNAFFAGAKFAATAGVTVPHGDTFRKKP